MVLPIANALPRALPPSFLIPSLRHCFSAYPPLGAKKPAKNERTKRIGDIYASRQALLRKEANLRRRAALREEEAKSLGDPIRGVPTPFVRSFDYETIQDAAQVVRDADISVQPSNVAASHVEYLDHGLDHKDLAEALDRSRMLTEPIATSHGPMTDLGKARAAKELWERQDKSATEAIQRITSLANASSQQRTKKNIERVVDKFGRHNTDPSTTADVRAGPDTGSSEVQIGILTAKIRVLADRYQGEGRQDKINKRNLRLLLHRRQKLLKYFERKERGSERWRNLISTLGLTPATWRGEIAVR